MEKNIIDLEMLDNVQDSGVFELALVDEPAINKIWMAMAKEKFVNPSSGETEDEFIPRCIAKLVGDEGYENDQAAAICYSTWSEAHASQKGFKMNDAFLWPDGQEFEIEPNPCWEGYEPYGLKDDGTPNCIPVKAKELKFAETYTDYPEGAVNNAKRALEWADKNGWGDCGMGAGKARANQLANREAISEDTIARMSAFERHRQNSETPYTEGCGKLMWDAWGGDAGIRWAKNKLREIRGEEFSYDTSALPAYTDQVPKKKKMKMADECPEATQDIAVNLANRQEAIDVANYGPLNPNRPSEGYWKAKARMFNDNVEDAKSARCKNCAFFITAQKVLDCIAEGIGSEAQDPYDVIEAGQLGYCEAFDFKCAAERTCDAWVVSSEEKMSKFYFASEDQQILVGPVAIPDLEIIRQDEKTKKPYWVRFSADVISRMAEKFMKENRNNETNIQHDNKVDAKSYIYESWIVESESDKANSIYDLNVPVGTWVVKMRVTDPRVWKQIKSGKLTGFSLEGNFIDKKELEQLQKDKSTYEKIMKILKSV